MAGHSIKGKTVLIAGGAKNLGGLIARDLRGKARKQWRSTTAAQAENQKPTLLLPPSRPQARGRLRFKPT